GRRRDLPHARHRGRATRPPGAHLRGVGVGRRAGVPRRALLRRAHHAPATRRRQVRLRARGVRHARRFRRRLGRGPGHQRCGDRRDRRGRGGVPRAPARLAARAHRAARRGAGRAVYGHQPGGRRVGTVGAERGDGGQAARPGRRGGDRVRAGDGAGWHGALAGAPVGLGVWVAIALAAHPVIWTYYGYPDLAKIAGEVVDPSRTLPRILLGGLAGTAVLYLALNAAFLQVLPLERIAASNPVA